MPDQSYAEIEFPSLQGRVSPEEWQTRIDLAAAYRMGYHFGWNNGAGNHISARVPGADEHFLINPFGFGWDEMTASNLVKIDLEGNIQSDVDCEINRAGFVIHSAIHAARPDVTHIIHHHSEPGVAVASMAEGFLFLNQDSVFMYGILGYHDYEGVSVDYGEKQRLVEDLGDNMALVLRNHGLLCCGGSMGEAFFLMDRFNKACDIQLRAMAAGGTLVPVSQQVCEDARTRGVELRRRGNQVLGRGERDWPMYVRRAERLDAGFRE